MAPARPLRQRELIDETALRDLSTPEAARETATLARESVSVVEWLEHVLHPWTSFVIVPLFALANAGIPLDATTLSNAAGSRITLGVVVGLVVGKTVGITAFTWVAVRARIGVLPAGARWIHVVGVAALGGIGFTVSIFVAGLAFEEATPLGAALQDEAKVGILAASLVAALLGTLILTRIRPGLGADRPAGRAKAQSGAPRGTTGGRSTSGGR